MDLEHHQIGNAIQGVSDSDANVEHDSRIVPLVAKKIEKTKYQIQWKRIMTLQKCIALSKSKLLQSRKYR